MSMDRSGKGRWGSWGVTMLHPQASFLEGTAANDYSQFGEDGLLDALFTKIGTLNRWCFEVGAHDGTFFSNTKRLRDAGWSALLIEADDKVFPELTKHASPTVYCVRHRIVGDDLDRLLDSVNAPCDLDLGVIDVDGQEWWLWKALTVYRPRVLLIEYSSFESSAVPPQGSELGQAGLREILELAQDKAYVALARTRTNVLLCTRQAWESTFAG